SSDVCSSDLKQDVLPGLRHRTVSGGNAEDRSVHLGSPGDHVFHVVGVTRAVHVSIVTIFGFILDVGGGDGDPPLFFFRRLVDLIIGGGNRSAGFGKHGGDRRGQRGFSVVDVTDGADIDVRLGALKFGFSHDTASSFVCFRFSSPPEPPGRVLQI